MNRLLLFCCLLFSATAYAQLERLPPSPPVQFQTTVGLTDIQINYSSPGVNGRKIFGEGGLAPFGEVWRTGADWPTHISFSEPVVLAGTAVAAGDYAFLATPGAQQWSISFYPYELAGWRWFMKQAPAFSIEVPAQRTLDFYERLEIGIADNHTLGAALYIAWENSRVSLPIETQAKEQVMAAIERHLSPPTLWDYLQAAQLLKAANADLQLALNYLDLAEAVGGVQNYRTYIQRSQIYTMLGRKSEALEAARQALPLAIADDNPDFRILIERTINSLED